ncbi:LysR family transcriptional regulator, partial [Xanthomonas maliensis]|uniref:LysR family transcriptional regulator n=1 Tax=Xanthomonas maliensis TaxID=1321368 RepID=UPI0003B79F34
SIMKSDGPTAFTLDQFAVFVAVVEHNGFAAAARHMNRAQSAITYAIKGLEDESDVLLFDRSTYRPTLTEAGRSLLPRARRLLMDLQDFNRQAKSFNAGVEAALTVVSDVFAPTGVLAYALARLHTQFPTISVKLIVETPLAA